MDRRVAAVLSAFHEMGRGLALDAVGGVEGERFPRCNERCLVHYAELAGYALGLARKPLRQ